MKRLLCLFLIVFATNTWAETYIQINGASLHDKPGYNGANYGLGIEQTITRDWSIAGGWYRNSEYNGSAYAYGRYTAWQSDSWNFGIGLGVVTGYRSHQVLPMAFPELCYSYVCGIFLPQIEPSGASVIGLHLKLPISD